MLHLFRKHCLIDIHKRFERNRYRKNHTPPVYIFVHNVHALFLALLLLVGPQKKALAHEN